MDKLEGNRSLGWDSSSSADPVWDRIRTRMAQLSGPSEGDRDEKRREKLRRRAEALRAPVASQAAQDATTLLSFNSGDERYAVPLGEVAEIQPLDHYSPIPGSPPSIVGIIHWRGSILTLVDLGRLFGLPSSGIADYHVSIIVETSGRRIALAAREVVDITRIDTRKLTAAPELIGKLPAHWITGVFDGNRLLVSVRGLVLDDNFLQWRRST